MNIIISESQYKFIFERKDDRIVKEIKRDVNAIIKIHRDRIKKIYNNRHNREFLEKLLSKFEKPREVLQHVKYKKYEIKLMGLYISDYRGAVYKKDNRYIIELNFPEYVELLEEFGREFEDEELVTKFYKQIMNYSYDDIKSTLLHELVHVRDMAQNMAQFDNNKQKNSKISEKEKDAKVLKQILDKMYANRNSEYNAFFLQKLYEFTNKHELTSFSEFKDFMKDVIIFKKMSSKQKKRYLKRVAQYYMSKQKQNT